MGSLWLSLVLANVFLDSEDRPGVGGGGFRNAVHPGSREEG